MKKNKILLLEDVSKEVSLSEGEGVLFGSLAFFRTKNERQNFLFHYIRGKVPEGLLPPELNIIPVAPHNLEGESKQAKLWMYELNKKSGFEQFSSRSGTAFLDFFETRNVIEGTEIVPISSYELISWDRLKNKMLNYNNFFEKIVGLKYVAKNYFES